MSSSAPASAPTVSNNPDFNKNNVLFSAAQISLQPISYPSALMIRGVCLLKYCDKERGLILTRIKHKYLPLVELFPSLYLPSAQY